MRLRQLFNKILISLIIIIILGYGFIQAHKLIIGAKLYIESPANNTTVRSAVIHVSGIANRISEIKINDRKIYVDANNQFDEILLLSPGYNIIKISILDKFGRTNIQTRQIIYILDSQNNPKMDGDIPILDISTTTYNQPKKEAG